MTSTTDNGYKRALNTALRLLTRRDHTRYELSQKLRKRGTASDIISRVAAECERLNYLNDQRTAEVYIRQLKRKYGVHRIRSELKKKGINEDIAENLITDQISEPDELQRADRILQKKSAAFAREEDLKKRREKMYRFLRSRGFPNAVITRLIHDTSRT
jgi:regulatory protein